MAVLIGTTTESLIFNSPALSYLSVKATGARLKLRSRGAQVCFWLMPDLIRSKRMVLADDNA